MNNAKLIFGTMPIGNLKDLTYNLIDYIKTSDILAVENEEFIKEIIDYYRLDFNGKIISFSPKEFMQCGITHNPSGLWQRGDEILNKIFDSISLDKTVLCLSDEGSAIVQDPFDTIRREAITRDIKYRILPGPSSVIDSLCYSKFYNGCSFSFYGMTFYDENKKYIYENIKDSPYVSVLFYHHEIQEIFFKELLHNLGGDREATLLSNITTDREFIMDGTLTDIMNFVLNNNIQQPTLVISGKEK